MRSLSIASIKIMLVLMTLTGRDATLYGQTPSNSAMTKIADSSTTSAKMDEYLTAAVRSDYFSGTVLVVRDGIPIFAKSYGMADYEQGVPNRADTVFAIASITKQFTALAIMQLQEAGKLSVNDPICSYLQECPANWKSITIRHLLNHASGIPNRSSLPNWDEKLAMIDYTRDELVALFRDLPLEFVPGEKHKYSNSGYNLLGIIVERVSGLKFNEYLKKRIFEPAGMLHTYVEETRMLVPGRAKGYYSVGTQFINNRLVSPTTELGAAGIYTTAGDLMRWQEAFSGDKLISAKSRQEMLTPFKDGYGYGLRIGEKFGRPHYNHSGSLNGFSSFIISFPNDRLTTIILSNSDKASAGRAGMDLSAIALGEPYKLPTTQLPDILWDIIVSKGVPPALDRYRELKIAALKDYDFGDEMLVDLGYDLITVGKLSEAEAIFTFNLQQFPESAYSYDGLADIAAARGETTRAIALFEKSITIDPKNDYALEGLKKLRSKGRKSR